MPMSPEPKVFVLILSYNGRHWLEECLPSVLNLDYPNLDVVVIDNGSSDGTKAFVQKEFPQVQIVSLNPNVGYARGFNAGLEYAAEREADYFLVMNNDTIIDRFALTALVETAKQYERVGFVTGKVYFSDRPDVFQTVGKFEHPILWSGGEIGWGEKDTGQYNTITERIFVDDVYTLVSRKMYDETGGYDPDFFLQCEEWDWQLRAKRKGWHIYYTPSAKLWHKGSASTGGLGSPINRYFLNRNWIVVMSKHADRRQFVQYYVWEGRRVLIELIKGFVKFDSLYIKFRLANLIGFMSGTWWLVRQQPSTGVPKLIQHLTDSL